MVTQSSHQYRPIEHPFDIGACVRSALVVPGDVNDLAVLHDLVDRTIAEFGRLDTVVNNADDLVSLPQLMAADDLIPKAIPDLEPESTPSA